MPADDSPARRLVVAYAFAPYADTSAVAATKRVASVGEPFDLIANRLDKIRGRDESLEELVGGLVRRRATLSVGAMFAGRSAIQAFTSRGEQAVAQWSAEPGGTPYSSVYSRAHFIASNFLAARVVGERPGLHWQAELSDPLSRKATGELRSGPIPDGRMAEQLAEQLAHRGVRMSQEATVYEWAETLAYTLADEVVFTSPGQRDYCLSLVTDRTVRTALEGSARVAPHATLPVEWYSHRDLQLDLEPGVVHVGYFGGFYSSQNPRALLQAITLLAPEDRARIRLHLFTGQSEELSALVEQERVGDVARVQEKLPFLDFLAATRQMDLLLAIDAAPVAGDTAPHVRLSKWSDYVGSGTPVWGIVTQGSDLAGEDLAVRTPLNHVTATLQALTSLARDRTWSSPPGSQP